MALVMLVGYSGLYLFLYWLLRLLRMDRRKAALLGYTFTSTAVPTYGLTVLRPSAGGRSRRAPLGSPRLSRILRKYRSPFSCCMA
jgi:hypothetical protein